MQSTISHSQLQHNYFKLCKQLHPDFNQRATATEDFQNLQQIYSHLKINYYCSIHVSLLDALNGCDRYFEDEDHIKYVINIPKLSKKITQLTITIEKSIINLKVEIDLPSTMRLHHGYLVKIIKLSAWRMFWGGVVSFEIIEDIITIKIPPHSKNNNIYKLVEHGLFCNGDRNPLYIQLKQGKD
jgi:DnaJ-class molecular chaperone